MLRSPGTPAAALPTLEKVRRRKAGGTIFPVKDDNVWVLSTTVDPKLRQVWPEDKMIVRQEYHDLLVAILRSVKQRNQMGTVSDFEEE